MIACRSKNNFNNLVVCSAVPETCTAYARRGELGMDASSISRGAWYELGESQPSMGSSC